MKLFLVPGIIIIMRDKNVLGQEQEEGGREDLFLDLRWEQVKEDTEERGFDWAEWLGMKSIHEEMGLTHFTPNGNVTVQMSKTDKRIDIKLHIKKLLEKQWHIRMGIQKRHMRSKRGIKVRSVLIYGCQDVTASCMMFSNHLQKNMPLIIIRILQCFHYISGCKLRDH